MRNKFGWNLDPNPKISHFDWSLFLPFWSLFLPFWSLFLPFCILKMSPAKWRPFCSGLSVFFWSWNQNILGKLGQCHGCWYPSSLCHQVISSQWYWLPGMLKGLRPVLEGFVVTMHEGTCETGSQILRLISQGIWRTVHTSPSALWQQTPPEPHFSGANELNQLFLLCSLFRLQYEARNKKKEQKEVTHIESMKTSNGAEYSPTEPEKQEA